MHVSVKGTTAAGRPVCREWRLIATDGDGPCVPTLAASAIIRKLTTGNLKLSGAMPCIGILTLDDFMHEMRGLNILTSETFE
jgi:hypothetical protein